MNKWEVLHKGIITGTFRKPLLIGPPAIGKSYNLMLLFEQMGLPVFQCSCAEDILLQEWLGSWVMRGNSMVWNDGPWAKALKGGALVINEISRASVSIKDACLALIDNADTCRIALPNGETLKPHAGFVVGFTSNDNPDDCGMSAALISRFDVILEIDEPHPALIQKLENAAKGLGTLVKNSFSTPDKSIDPRAALNYLKFKQTFPEEIALELAFRERANDISMAWKLILARAREAVVV